MTRRGFSLIELMVVIGIIALLAAFAIPMLSRNRCRADWAEVQSCVADAALRMDNYRTNHGVYPTSNIPTLIGLSSPIDCGEHYRGSINATATTYRVTFNDTQKKLWCSENAGDDEWVMINTSQKVYHTKNPVDGDVDTIGGGS